MHLTKISTKNSRLVENGLDSQGYSGREKRNEMDKGDGKQNNGLLEWPSQNWEAKETKNREAKNTNKCCKSVFAISCKQTVPTLIGQYIPLILWHSVKTDRTCNALSGQHKSPDLNPIENPRMTLKRPANDTRKPQSKTISELKDVVKRNGKNALKDFHNLVTASPCQKEQN